MKNLIYLIIPIYLFSLNACLSDFEKVPSDEIAVVTANFNVTNNNCTLPCTLTFANTSQNASNYLWNFGDGTTTTTASPTHNYIDAGTYTVKLTAFNAINDSATIQQTVTILEETFVEEKRWTQKKSFPGIGRDFMVSFAVGGYGYVALGRDPNKDGLSDVWQYDPVNNNWTQKANFVDGGRIGATAFVINDKVYVCGGTSSSNNENASVWEYDYRTDTWLEKENQFPGTNREGMFSFVINDKAYVGGGDGGNDLWEYDPVYDAWEQKADPFKNIYYGVIFVLDNKGYVATGYSIEEDSYVKTIQMYDPQTDTWQQKNDFPGLGRAGAVAFVINGQAFLGTGFLRIPSDLELKDFWQYQATTDSWIQKSDFQGEARDQTINFVINQKAYIGAGLTLTNYLNDVWEYDCP